MQHPIIPQLLILQERDRNRRALETQLAAVPGEIGTVEARIAAEKAAIETARNELKSLEAKKKVLETEIGSAEEKAAKYRTQQLSVRKNDEYQALGKEIETMVKGIAEIEGQELEVMYAIDEARKRFVAAEAALKANISGHEARIKVLRERSVSLAAELAEAQAAMQAARQPLAESVLRLYDRIAVRQMPACVPVRAGKCDGCHLKVSGEVESAVRGKGDGALVTCDQCGRIVWWEAA